MNKFNWSVRACGAIILFAMTTAALPAQTLTTLNSFNNAQGVHPYAGLVQGTNGKFYGTTESTIYNITETGTFNKMNNLPDNGYQSAGLIQSTDGNFYGTTPAGGTSAKGTVFTITQTGAVTILYNFCSQTNCTDGWDPSAGLIHATDGNLYGTTLGGGVNDECDGGCGTVFKITPSGALTTLYSFCMQGGAGCTDGSHPAAALVQGTDGNFYGTASDGGANTNGSCPSGCGTVFQITPSGVLTTLHSFDVTDGNDPTAQLTQGTDGNFYGTTFEGGANGDYGTVFKITSGGTLTTLHSFTGSDGDYPQAGLVQGTDGNLYGTTRSGGAHCHAAGCGTIFNITTSGTLATLHSFDVTDGGDPVAGLVQGTNGNFYGTTAAGGTHNDGTVYSLSVGLGPFVKTNPTSGPVGASVTILGTNLTGATSVTFNGTTAVFKVRSSTKITTTVPAGATTGTVQVVTPGGTLSSNVRFTVN
jgi:uncharacterized repeat protein (TIGR03803 family)